MLKYGIIGEQIIDDLVTLQIQLDAAKKSRNWELMYFLEAQLREKEAELEEYREDILNFSNENEGGY